MENLSFRSIHRWTSIVFAVAVLVNVALNLVPGLESVALVVGGLTLLPLFVLLFTGLYLFALPYLARGRASRAGPG